MPQTEMFLIERRAPQGAMMREFIVDCAHGTTRVTVPNFPKPDPSRGSAVFVNLLDDHAKAMRAAFEEKAIDEECRCRPSKQAS